MTGSLFGEPCHLLDLHKHCNKMNETQTSDHDVLSHKEKKCKRCDKLLDSSCYQIAYVFLRKSDNKKVGSLQSYCKTCNAKMLHERWVNSEKAIAQKKKRMEKEHSKTKRCCMCRKEKPKS